MSHLSYTPPPSNDLCGCRKSGAYRTRQEADRALERILANPRTGDYPRAVHVCDEGIFHLTKNPLMTPKRRKS
jgi:hypothetical protein